MEWSGLRFMVFYFQSINHTLYAIESSRFFRVSRTRAIRSDPSRVLKIARRQFAHLSSRLAPACPCLPLLGAGSSERLLKYFKQTTQQLHSDLPRHSYAQNDPSDLHDAIRSETSYGNECFIFFLFWVWCFGFRFASIRPVGPMTRRVTEQSRAEHVVGVWAALG